MNFSEEVTNPLTEISFKQRQADIDAMRQKEAEQLKRERKSPFAHFYQINKDQSNFLRSCLDENPKALKLLFFIFDHMDKYNAVMCSYTVFNEALGMSKATIQRSIKYLKDNGFIHVAKSGSSNIYIANKNLVWNSWGNNQKYCQFPANVILSRSEQDDELELRDKRFTAVEVKN